MLKQHITVLIFAKVSNPLVSQSVLLVDLSHLPRFKLVYFEYNTL